MRAAYYALILAAGCNQIFGNNEVGHIDSTIGEAGIDAAFGNMQLRYAVAATPLAPAAFSAIPGAKVQVGSMTDFTDLKSRSLDGNGSFTIPFEILELTPRYRLVYTPADSVPVEFQTSLKTASFVVPQIGRVDRTTWPRQSPPAGGSIPLNFTGAPATYPSLWVLGTGLWSRLTLSGEPSSASLDYSFVMSESGPVGVPMASHGDTIVFALQPAANTSVSAYAYTTFEGFDAGGNPVNPVRSDWKTTGTSKSLKWGTSQSFSSFGNRAEVILGNTGNPADSYWAGVMPATDVSPFTDVPINDPNQLAFGLASAEYDRVAFAPLATPNGTTNPLTFLDPYTGAAGEPPAFPTAMYTFGSAVRQWGSTNLSARSGGQIIMPNDGAAGTMTMFDEGVGLANNITLTPAGGQGVLINSANDDAAIPHAASYQLVFSTDAMSPAGIPSDCMTTLYNIAPPNITAVRRYLTNTLPTPALPIVIDGQYLQSGSTYAFGIACYRGHPNAITGDWATISFPFAATMLYTKLFLPA